MRAVGDQAVILVGGRAGHAERLEDVAAHIRQKLFFRRTLDDCTDDVESITRVGKPCARGSDERVVHENRQTSGDGCVVLVQCEFVPLVVPDARQVPAQQSRGDDGAFVRKCRDVALDGCIEVELPRFVQLRDCVSSQRLGDTADAKLRRGRRGAFGCEVGIAESLRPNDPTIHRDCQGEARDVRRQLLTGDGVCPRARGIPPVRDRREFGGPRNTRGLLHGEQDEQDEHEL